MDNMCAKHKTKAILFCIDDNCSKGSRMICSRCESQGEHDSHQIELIESIPMRIKQCALQEVPQECLLASIKKQFLDLRSAFLSLLERYETQLCLFTRNECTKINKIISRGRSFSVSKFQGMSIQDQDIFIDLVNNKIGFDSIITNINSRTVQLTQAMSHLQQILTERLNFSTFTNTKILEMQIDFIEKFKTKSFALLSETQIVIGEEDGSLKLIDLERKTQILSVELKHISTNFSIEKISSSSIAAYEYSSNYIEIVNFTLPPSKNITILKNKVPRLISQNIEEKIYQDKISCIKCVVLGELFAIGYTNGQLKIYDQKKRDFIFRAECIVDNLTLEGEISCIDSMDNLISAGGVNGFISVWNWKTGDLMKEVRKAYSKDGYESVKLANRGRKVTRIVFLNSKELFAQREGENEFSFYSLENESNYSLGYLNVTRFLYPIDVRLLLTQKPVYSLPLDEQSFTPECSRGNIIFIQNDVRKTGRTLQVYNHQTNSIIFSLQTERNSEIFAAYLTSNIFIILYQDGLIHGYQ